MGVRFTGQYIFSISGAKEDTAGFTHKGGENGNAEKGVSTAILPVQLLAIDGREMSWRGSPFFFCFFFFGSRRFPNLNPETEGASLEELSNYAII
jgi:hypothetical protein